MTESSAAATADPNTGAGLIEFLDASIEKGWFNVSSARALKTATQKIFEVESGWESMDLRSLDPDSLFERFRNLKRNAYSDDSMRIYRTRFRQALKMHLARVDGDGNWKSYGPSARASSSAKPSGNGSKGTNGTKVSHKSSAADTVSEPNLASEPDDLPATSSYGGDSVPLMRFPFPLRDAVDVFLTLPRDLTKDEAERLSIFIRSLARAEVISSVAVE